MSYINQQIIDGQTVLRAQHIANIEAAINDNQDQINTIGDVPNRCIEYMETLGDIDEKIAGKADVEDTVLTTTLSRGRKADELVGEGSFAFGDDVVAANRWSTAFGADNTCTGQASTAFGTGNSSENVNSFAMGEMTKATGRNAVSQGLETVASGFHAHAEGMNTTAKGRGSHAEGAYTFAQGYHSHAAGYGTNASGKSQFVFGEYNVMDNNSSISDYGTYIEIVGNGTGSSARHNARTLDWDGNESLAGGLTLGKGTADEITVSAEKAKFMVDSLSAEVVEAANQSTLSFTTTPSTTPLSGGTYIHRLEGASPDYDLSSEGKAALTEGADYVVSFDVSQSSSMYAATIYVTLAGVSCGSISTRSIQNNHAEMTGQVTAAQASAASTAKFEIHYLMVASNSPNPSNPLPAYAPTIKNVVITINNKPDLKTRVEGLENDLAEVEQNTDVLEKSVVKPNLIVGSYTDNTPAMSWREINASGPQTPSGQMYIHQLTGTGTMTLADEFDIEEGDHLCLSFAYVRNSAAQIGSLSVSIRGASQSAGTTMNPTSGTGSILYTVTASQVASQDNTVTFNYTLQVQDYTPTHSFENDKDIVFSKVKLEKGSFATPWRPATEDYFELFSHVFQ